MDWSKGFTSRYYATIVDPSTWRDILSFDITGGSIKLTDSGLRESADLDCSTLTIRLGGSEYEQSFNENEYWVRVYLDARQESDNQLIPLFTGLASSPNRNFSGPKETNKLTCYSVLKPAEDVLLPLGDYVRAGTNGAKAVRDLLKDVVPAPISIEGQSPALTSNLVAESGETKLSMADYILGVIGWRLRIDGDGSVVICEEADEPSAVFNSITNDVLGLEVDVENNWYECPNVFRVTNDDMMAVARDENPDSQFSIQNRGREIWMEESSADLNDGETLGQYAQRRLEEAQRVMYKLSYERRFDPYVRVGDMVWITYPSQGIDGGFVSQSQSINLSYGAAVSEEAVMA